MTPSLASPLPGHIPSDTADPGECVSPLDHSGDHKDSPGAAALVLRLLLRAELYDTPAVPVRPGPHTRQPPGLGVSGQ